MVRPHVKPETKKVRKSLNIENTIAFLKLLSVEDRPIMVIDGCTMRQCVVSMASIPTMLELDDNQGGIIGNLRISIPENYDWDDMVIDGIIEMLETCVYDYDVVWTGCFDLSNIVLLDNTTVFSANSDYYVGVEDIPKKKRKNAVEVPYNEDMELKSHRIISLIKSANKQ